jgi:hypothetical protein
VREAVDHHRLILVRQVEPIVAWGLDRIGAGQLDPELATHALVAAGENAIRLTLTEPDGYSPQRFADFAGDVVAALSREADVRSAR